MDNRKKVKPKISFWTVLYFVLVVALIIGTNIFMFVRIHKETKDFRERTTINLHHYHYLPYGYDSNDPDSRPKRRDSVYNVRISEIYGKPVNGNTIRIPEIRPEQIGNEYSMGWLQIDFPDETDWYCVDNNTAFTIEPGGEKVAALKPGDEISFEYALYDDSNILILGFIEPAVDDCDDWFGEITIEDIGHYALIDLIPLAFFI